MDKILEHTITIGLNDKDTKKEKWYYKLFPFLVTRKIENILYKQGIDGYTMIKSKGGYRHDNGQKVKENSIVVYMYFVERVQILNAISDLKTKLNQESIVYKIAEVQSQLV